ncbi:MAG: carboxylating nicotinate-nucleotide diphosphorylase [Pseudomonadota bacterium]|nr:carboxylating nicotinate-nucleotide diphosphorylase [Pseudomonadota bacterium]
MNRPSCPNKLPEDIAETVRRALAEDLGGGDITAALISEHKHAQGYIVSKDTGRICGIPWALEVFRQLNNDVCLDWRVEEGDPIEPGQKLCDLRGPAKALMSGERTALNFLQTLSATTTQTANFAKLIQHTPATLLDTRKTLPGLRTAQKYAVAVGGGKNHRMGLFDAYLIKENHIVSCGGIAAAIAKARAISPGKTVQIEVQNLDEMEAALTAHADVIMLDNFSISELEQAVSQNKSRAKLEASGGIEDGQLVKIAETGVDYISVGALTKHCRALDLSMLIDC